MKKWQNLLLKFLSIIIRKDKDLITLLFRGYSGSNLSPIIERLESNKIKDFKIKIVRDDFQSTRTKSFSVLKNKLIKYKYVLKSDLVISTHGFYRLRKDTKMLNLWHGIPIKSMSLMNKSKKDKINFIKDDVFLSTSEFFNTIMNACIGIRAENYYIAGYPRNDYLINEDGIKNLELILGKKIEKKIALYMPTYRDVGNNQQPRGESLFGFKEFDVEVFNRFLEANNLIFMIKLHPNEEKLFMNNYFGLNSENFILIRDEDLENNKMDFYKVVNAADILITDYSSVYFDYLLLDKPMIFTPVDFKDYKESRGFLLEPYDFWTPGPKCLTQHSLQKEILKSITDTGYYNDERTTLKNIIHKYQDGKSTERVEDLIIKMLKN